MILTVAVGLADSPAVVDVGTRASCDFRARVAFTAIDETQTARSRQHAVYSGQVVNAAESRKTVSPVIERYPAGTILQIRGEPVTELQLSLLREEQRAWDHGRGTAERIRAFATRFCVVLFLCVLVAVYIASFQAALSRSLPRLLIMCGQVVVTIGLTLALARTPWQAQVVPLTASALIFALVFDAPFALLMAFGMCLACQLEATSSMPGMVVHIGGLATLILMFRGVRTRPGLIQVAVAGGLAFAALTATIRIANDDAPRLIAIDAVRQLGWALLAVFIWRSSLPLIERLYGIVTDATLLELADSSSPLLRELARRAPGTYTHSVAMATLAEAAAEAIGANPLLARVGCYYHDVGKMVKPHYFIENQTEENHHERLEPALSTLIIMGHVKDGVALAEQYRLPRPVIDFIEQHHGTTLVEYFYREAQRLQEENDYGRGEFEYAFRYPGPKPRSREVAIVMLADCIESASRTLTAPTPRSLRKLVHELIMKRLLDGQFEESGLTLTDLHLMEERLFASAIALYHARVRYGGRGNRSAA